MRFRLTLWYSLVLAVTLLAVEGGIYFFLRRSLEESARQTVVERGEKVAQATVSGPLGPRGEFAVLLPRMDVFTSPDLFIQAVDAFGAVVARSENLGRSSLPLTKGTKAAIRSGKAAMERITVNGEELFLYSRPMFPDVEGTGVIQVALSLKRQNEFLSRLRLLFLAGFLLAVLSASGLGAFLARQALLPIKRMTETAREIGMSGDLRRRVEYRGPQDELGELASTFNEMLSRLEAAHRRLESTLEGQKRFVADASHELRNPLAAIRLNLLSLLNRLHPRLEPEERELLASLTREAERLSRLVADLLTLARADAGLGLDLSPLDLHEVAREALEQSRILGEGLEMELLSSPGKWVLGNRDYLKQFLLILLDNAIKYTPRGGRVEVEVESGNGEVVVGVRDTGPGIPPEERERIFERFYRREEARPKPGAGLGLAIARWIADQHGGRLELESWPGQGSLFRLRLKALPVPAEARAS